MKDVHDIIRGPVLTEKSYDQIPMKKYTFEVAPGANKTEIKSAVEEIFGVQVECKHLEQRRQNEKAGLHQRQNRQGEKSSCDAQREF